MKKKIVYIPIILLLVLLSGCTTAEGAFVNAQLVDENGDDYGIRQVDNKPRVSSMDYLYDIVEGNVPGHEAWIAEGYNPNVGTTQEDMWSYSTAYVWPVAETQMEVVSSSVQDDVGGTGVITVYINYLDGNYNEYTETVSMNGTTAVPTVAKNIYRVNNFRAASVGTGGQAAGNIELRGIGGGTVYSYMLATYTRARNIVFTVPKDKILYITSIAYSCSEATKGVRFINRATYDYITGTTLTPGLFFMPYADIVLFNTSYNRPLEVPTRFIEGVDITVAVISGQAGAIADCVLRGWIEDE